MARTGVVQLDDKWRVEADTSCWALVYDSLSDEINPTTGKPTRSYLATYHPTLETAIQYYVDEQLKTEGSAIELLDKIRGLHASIHAALEAGVSKKVFPSDGAIVDKPAPPKDKKRKWEEPERHVKSSAVH